jgi:F0F1-type ATP synthase membrane subunit c/vacuolar-type H+-ATPase subunit K
MFVFALVVLALAFVQGQALFALVVALKAFEQAQ